MGFNHGRKRGNGGGGSRKENVFNQDKRDNRCASYKESVSCELMQNHSFDAFYRALPGFIQREGEGDWDAFITALRSPLPACLRINPSNPFASTLKSQLQAYSDAYYTSTSRSQQSENGEEQVPDSVTKQMMIEQLKWYPGGNAYKVKWYTC
jgi:hypothetical protein